MRKIQLPLLLVAAAVATAACTPPSGDAGSTASTIASSKPPVATINGKEMSGELFDVFIDAVTNGQPDTLTEEQKSQALDQLISMWLAAEVSEKDGLANDPEVQARLALLRLQVLAEASTSKHAEENPVTDEEVRAEFDTQVAGMPKEYKARHILVDDEAEAVEITAELEGGADFAKLAKAKSKDKGSAEKGGDLGWFSPQTMVAPFAEAVVVLEEGAMTTAPVQSDFGWHIILLEGVREPEAPDFEQVKPQVESLVRRKHLQEYLDELRAGADIQKKI